MMFKGTIKDNSTALLKSSATQPFDKKQHLPFCYFMVKCHWSKWASKTESVIMPWHHHAAQPHANHVESLRSYRPIGNTVTFTSGCPRSALVTTRYQKVDLMTRSWQFVSIDSKIQFQNDARCHRWLATLFALKSANDRYGQYCPPQQGDFLLMMT